MHTQVISQNNESDDGLITAVVRLRDLRPLRPLLTLLGLAPVFRYLLTNVIDNYT